MGAILLIGLDSTAALTFTGVWLVSAAWTTVRAGFGLARIWPGIGAAPLRVDGPS